ncbi:MAG: hypothetical protein MJ191_05340 [Clostridium sp.]|nr:hypothetical protein [Clostridium sp.]
MKSRNTILYIMAIILFINFLVVKANPLILSPEEAERIEMLLKENNAYVHDEDKRVLQEYMEKLTNHEILSQEEKDYLRECYLNMIKNKLGEEKFNEYCKLIEKRSSSTEFTQPERFRLYELEKELRESH